MPRPREEPHCVVVPLKSVNHHSQPHVMPCMKWRILCLPVGRGQCAAGTRLLLTHLSFSRALIKAFVSLKSLKIVQPFNRMLSETEMLSLQTIMNQIHENHKNFKNLSLNVKLQNSNSTSFTMFDGKMLEPNIGIIMQKSRVKYIHYSFVCILLK